MKRCPTCNRTYDVSMTFCLEDGSLLTATAEPQPTILSQLPPPTVPFGESTTQPASHHTQKESSSVIPRLLVALFVLAAIGIGVYLWMHRSNSTASASVAPSPSPTTNEDMAKSLASVLPSPQTPNRNANNANSTESTTGELPIPKVYGKTYDAARRVLIKSGWIPNKHEGIHGDDADTQSGNGPVFWKRGYWEVDSCSGTGAAHCKFEFFDPSKRVLIVITEGEEDPDGSYHATVSRVYLKQ